MKERWKEMERRWKSILSDVSFQDAIPKRCVDISAVVVARSHSADKMEKDMTRNQNDEDIMRIHCTCITEMKRTGKKWWVDTKTSEAKWQEMSRNEEKQRAMSRHEEYWLEITTNEQIWRLNPTGEKWSILQKYWMPNESGLRLIFRPTR